MKVSDILRLKGGTLYTVTPDETLARAIETMAEKDLGSLVVMEYGDLVGMLTFREINQVLARMRGRVLPFGWWHYLRRYRTIDRLRVGFLGVKPEYQYTGAAAQLYIEHFDVARSRR